MNTPLPRLTRLWDRVALITGFVVALFLAYATAAAPRSATKADAPLYFTFRVENRTGHEIHVRGIVDGNVVFEESGNWKTAAELNGQPRYPGTFPYREAYIPLPRSATAITISEDAYLHQTKTLSISGFAEHTKLDFRVLLGPTEIALTQDLDLGISNLTPQEAASPNANELRLRARADDITYATVGIINRSGRPLHFTLVIDGQQLLDASLPAERVIDPKDASRHRLSYPAHVTKLPMHLGAQHLTLQTDQEPRAKSFDISGLPGTANQFRLTVTTADVLLETGTGRIRW